MKIQSKDTVVTLANAIKLVTAAAHEVIGQRAGSLLQQETGPRKALANLVASRINAHFSKHTSQQVKG